MSGEDPEQPRTPPRRGPEKSPLTRSPIEWSRIGRLRHLYPQPADSNEDMYSDEDDPIEMDISARSFLTTFHRNLVREDRVWNRHMIEIRDLAQTTYATAQTRYRITGSETWLIEGVSELLVLSHTADSILNQFRPLITLWNENVERLQNFVRSGRCQPRYRAFFQYAHNYFRVRAHQYLLVYQRILMYINALQSELMEDDWSNRNFQLPAATQYLAELGESSDSESDEEEADEGEADEEEDLTDTMEDLYI